MPSGWTNFAVNVMLEKYLRGTAGAPPPNFYAGLFSATPSDTGGGTELTAAVLVGYSRKILPVAPGTWNPLALGATTNAAVIDFGIAGVGSVSVTQWGLWDALTAGNLWYWADLTPPQIVSVGNPYSFAPEAFGIACI